MLLLCWLPTALLSLTLVLEAAGLDTTPFQGNRTSDTVDDMSGIEDESDEDYPDNKEGSADWATGRENQSKGPENRESKTATIIIVCSVLGTVALLIVVIVVMKFRPVTCDQGAYSLPPGANE